MRSISRTLVAAAAAASLALLGCAPEEEDPDRAADGPGAAADGVALAIHGGAGAIQRGEVSEEREREYRDALREAVTAGHRILEDGGSAVDAVVAAIVLLEDNDLFNAGRGAVFTHDGRNELDASIMEGGEREAGAVAGVTRVRNPIRLAREVMESSEHVMFAREGGETFAEDHGLEMVEEEYFFTERRYEALQRAQEREGDRSMLDHDADRYLGTVGAVALDARGNLAAGTSTGGMTNKRFGRVGDSPIIGAGTYADNRTCAVSATGHGEFFIRNVVAYDVCAHMEYLGWDLARAAEHVILEKLVERGGSGGIIAIDAGGNISMPHNTPGMYRASVDTAGNVRVMIFGDEDGEGDQAGAGN